MLNENERIKVNDFIERAIKELKNKPTTDVSLIKSILWNSFNENYSNKNITHCFEKNSILKTLICISEDEYDIDFKEFIENHTGYYNLRWVIIPKNYNNKYVIGVRYNPFD